MTLVDGQGNTSDSVFFSVQNSDSEILSLACRPGDSVVNLETF